MRWYRVCPDALPAWVPQRYLPAECQRYVGDVVEKRVYFYNRFGKHIPSDEFVYRLLGRSCNRDGWIYVAERWYWYAKLELFLLAANSFLFRFLIRQGILAGPEGGFFHEFHFNDPALWRWK